MFDREKMVDERILKNMRDADEFEMLLGEIPQVTASLNLHPTLRKQNHQQNSHVDNGYGHASFMSHQKLKSHLHSMYDNEFLQNDYGFGSSPVTMNGFSLQSDSSSPNLYSGGARSLSDFRSPSPPTIDDMSFYMGSQKANEGRFITDFNLTRNFSNIHINGGEQEGFSVLPNGIHSCDQSLNGDFQMDVENYGASGYNLPVPRGSVNIEGDIYQDQRFANLMRSRYSPPPFEESFSSSDVTSSPQFYRTNVYSDNNFHLGFSPFDVSPNLNRPSVGDTFSYASRNRTNLVEARDAFYSPDMMQFSRRMPHYNDENLLHYRPFVPQGRNKVPHGVPSEDSLIHQGKGFNYRMNRGKGIPRGHGQKGFSRETRSSKLQEMRSNGCLSSPSLLLSKCSSLSEAQGYIYHIAKDQNGCRFLQRMFDEGTSRDVQIIFNEIIDHVVELMMDPFGNYLMQKLLDVCTDEQRFHILLRVTEKPGELVKISLNTHGTRVVQKLIETLKQRQLISLIISALEPGFLDLIKDLNGNHVVQRCLQCFGPEDSKFIFVAAAKYCVEIAKHQHGCCVLQRCISRSTGQHRETLVAEVSANGLLLAQDAFGNYVVQYILEQIPSAASKLISQFEGNYVQLSGQKSGSHVVEKCLSLCNDEVRSKIILELLSAPYFDQLLQDPHANYVIQTALKVSQGHLHNSLVRAIESHKAISRNSPYSKRIFSHKLLKR